MSSTLLDTLVSELGKILAPISAAVKDPKKLSGLLATIGATPEEAGGDRLATALGAVVDVSSQIDQLAAQPSPSLASISAVLEASRKAFTALHGLDTAGSPAAALEGFGVDLADLVIAIYLWNWHPLAHAVAALATLIEPAGELDLRPPVGKDGILLRAPFRLDRFHLDRLGALVRDPAAALRAEYGNSLATLADANAMADKLFPRVVRVLRGLGVSCRYGFDPADAPLLKDAAPFVDHALIVYAEDMLVSDKAEAGVVLTFSSADRGDLGLVVNPFGALTSTWQVEGWSVEIDLAADVQGVAYGRHGFTLLAAPGTAEVSGKLTATPLTPDNGPTFILGAPNGSRLEIGSAKFTAETALSETKQSLALSADVSKSTIVIASGDGDGFLHSILPPDGLKANFDFGIAWSNEQGLTFRGSGGLDATLPVGISIGGVFNVPTIHLALQASDAAVLAEVSASVALALGPFQALVDRVGVSNALTFPKSGGNLGGADLTFGFKPPSGVGLVIDAYEVSGGGFLFFDPDKEQYAGVLQLELAKTIAIKAIGLLTTRMPDGSKGFSLLLIITAEGFSPIQLGFGFTLTGIGGLLGVNRTASVDALRSGIKNGTLGSILFPADPVRNAARLVSDVGTVFPPAPNRYLFGPMAQIGWGTPTILTLEIGLVLEIPDPVRLLILGRLKALLPDESNALVRLRMDALGVIDFGKGEFSLDATLYDSRVLNFVLSGDMAMRANWGNNPGFILAVGGFNPRFPTPAGFPSLSRLALVLANSDNAKLRLECYMALTSNTAQFGALVDFYFGAGSFSVDGHLGFDALFHFAPFSFIADLSASVALRFDGDILMGVGLDMTLSGPSPWHVWGVAHFKILFFSQSIHFDSHFGSDEQPALPPPVDVQGLLIAALSDVRNWSSELPANERPLVAFRAISTSNNVLRVHPLATLAVRERVVPLHMPITKFGSAPISGTNNFSVKAVRSDDGKDIAGVEDVQDSFALAQFVDMSDDEKLSLPAFSQESAGIRFTSNKFAYASGLDTTISYNTLMVSPDQAAQKLPPQVLQSPVLESAATFSAVAQAGKRGGMTSGSAIFQGAQHG